MTDNDPDHAKGLDYSNPLQAGPSSRSLLLFTWLGTIFFFTFNCIGVSVGRWGTSRAIIGVFLSLAMMALASGLIASIVGIKSDSSGSIRLGLFIGLIINGMIFALFSILIIRAILSSPTI